jgi:hypothetical protein
MGNEKEIRHEVQKTLHSLDGLQPVETDDHFYARVKGRIQQGEIEAKAEHWFWVAAAAVIILLLTNMITIRGYQQSYGNSDSHQINDDWEALAEEYISDTPMIYEFNSQE